MVIKKISIEDYLEKTVLYSKQIRGGLEFYIETHNLDNGAHAQIYIYRKHERIKDFIAIRDKADNFTEQKSKFKTEAQQLKFLINDQSYIFNCSGETEATVLEINYNQDLKDLTKGKCAILIDLYLTNEMENSKMLNELKALGE